MTTLTVSALYRYPVKSLRGDAHAALEIDARGFRFDRHWMVVDERGHFLTQRQLPRMALVDASVGDDGGLTLRAPGMPDIAIAPAADTRLPVTVWKDSVDASLAGPEAADWLGRFLERPCRLVQFAPDVVRAVDPAFATPADQTGFSDGFPFLLISQASLDALNARLEHPLPMLRFRPNIVVTGCAPHAEDDWRVIRIGEVVFRVVKPCSRCAIPTIDPATGLRGPEPLRTLTTYRRHGNMVFFGQNLIHDGPGRLETGMRVEVLE
ncbi:MOSC domain-containing protein [Azoarcus sp. L1K30]|uniref:MOSC domain-containing protein n=1 Tax=Azoarcus sp. L1K30 TaxID=2820277 RepID=UPI001B8319D3|nr:MOSC domain-containing protein [Azoarcus sp. L1K30]